MSGHSGKLQLHAELVNIYADIAHGIRRQLVAVRIGENAVEQLAQQFYLSSSYLSRLFKRETGTTLTTYLQNVRIEAAKNLLRTTALKSYEVAERVGINDPVYFSRIFKKITGLKPKDYRHSVQNESSV